MACKGDYLSTDLFTWRRNLKTPPHTHLYRDTWSQREDCSYIKEQWWCPVLLVYCHSWLLTGWVRSSWPPPQNDRTTVCHSRWICVCKFVDWMLQTDGKKVNTVIQKSEENTLYSSWYTSYYVTLPTLYDIMSNNNVICDPLLKGVFCKVHITFVASAITFGDMPTH